MSTQPFVCHSCSEQIPLYAYGELPPEQEELFEQHLSACTDCTAALGAYRRVMSALDEVSMEPAPNLLSECRYGLRAALEAEQRAGVPSRIVSGGWWTQQFHSLMHSSIGFRVPVGAMALIAVGFFAAKVAPDLGARTAQASLTNVHSVQADASGNIQIGVDDTQRKTISGSITDPKIRKLLIDASQDAGDAGVRVESVDMLKDYCAMVDVRNALMDRLLKDPNPGVRMKAIEGLKRFGSDPNVRKTLATVLAKDANPGVRMQAIDLLTAQQDTSLVGLLQTLMQKEDNSYVRLKMRGALEDMRASVGTF